VPTTVGPLQTFPGASTGTLERELMKLTTTIAAASGNHGSGGGANLASNVGGGAIAGGLLGGPAGAGIGAALGGIKSIFDLISSLPSSFNAPSAIIYKNTLNDISGVIGNTLVPVFRIFNSSARFVGDTLATVAPRFYTLFERIEAGFNSLKPVFDDAQTIIIAVVDSTADLVGSLFDVTSSLDETTGGVGTLRDVVQSLGRATVFTIEAVRRLIQNMLIFRDPAMAIGTTIAQWGDIVQRTNDVLDRAAHTPRRSSVGAGTYTASYMDLESYEKKIRESAFSMGQGISSAFDKDQREKGMARDINKIAENTSNLDKFTKFMGDMNEQIKRIQDEHSSNQRRNN